ncbi:hypothetical protein [Beggiatoa leptomitoformis]|uniref:DUF1190 domain-containing protein n=1 Tax=Beggiatoa leptomitoformis TaxID=288004 RepID=A0A2N9YE56_9GAMM|nr:hypothetical protein [Beggiatoa leptomitoformis]ALG68870.1 hypothetical protein AL038_15660 [Beggiatoa leptomitoformis]AUI68760.1 hypothetical protein BLE401_08595 [Beggiatoa leptomitoformis]
MKKSAKISLLFITPTALTLISCSDNTPTDMSFKNKEECSIYYSNNECDKIVSQSRPMFESLAECEKQAGVGKCESTYWQGQQFWMPSRQAYRNYTHLPNSNSVMGFNNNTSRWYVPSDATADMKPRRAIATSYFMGTGNNTSTRSSTSGTGSSTTSSSIRNIAGGSSKSSSSS